MAKNSIAFRPVRGTEAQIAAMPITEGYAYFAIDSGKIYIDKNQKRVPMGGSGAAIIYADGEAIQNSDDDYYAIYRDSLEDEKAVVREGDLIINSDGAFYRVMEVTANAISCIRIAVSGTGGGSGSGSGEGGSTTVAFKRGRLSVTENNETDILNGSECTYTITATSGTEDGVAIDDRLKLDIALYVVGASQPYYTESMTINHGQTIVYDATKLIRQSTETKVVFKVSGSAANKFYSEGQLEKLIYTHELTVDWVASQFSNIKYFINSIGTSIRFSTGAKRILDVYFDDALVFTQTYDKTDVTASAAPTITKDSDILNLDGSKTGQKLDGLYSHGRHVIKAKLSLAKAGTSVRGDGTDFITKEIALYLEEGYPLIWFGDMKSEYYEFDNPLVPIRVYDPHAGAEGAKVYLFADGADVLDGEYYSISNDATSYLYWTLTDLTANQNIAYQVRVGEDKYELYESIPDFKVLADPRNMGIASQALAVNFDSRGRSNAESAKRRATIKLSDDKAAVLEGFNWYNNGWVMDDANTTCLRISNGAKVTIPIGALTFAGNLPSHTIEMRMKIRNVQSYEKLITTYTRYKVSDDEKVEKLPTTNKAWKDDAVFAEFLAQRKDGIASYDAYLTKRLPQLRETDITIPTYDELGFASLYRDYDLSSAMVKYIANESNPVSEAAICLGPQDGYFSNGTDAVTVDYVEDEIINLTIVYDNGSGSTRFGNNKLMKFYLNGMLTSVARSGKTTSWDIKTPNLVIDSAGCDIDLYKFRVYDRALGLNEVLKNVAYDDKDTTSWDLAELYTANQTIDEDYQFSFNKMITYNKNHPDTPIMPYIVFTTDDTNIATGGKLPWRKDTPVKASMEFVNPSLDRAYANGELSQIAEAAGVDVDDYYLHHCPSWIADTVDLSVQGTSSEFYPRRNYKAKTKVKMPQYDAETGAALVDEYNEPVTSSEYMMRLHKGPFAAKYEAGEADKQKFFYYDNNTVGTNKFTLKIDFMESSGSYNMGLANLVNNAYSHHPLQDYNGAGAFVTGTAGQETELSAYPADQRVWYRNHKGNWKLCLVDTVDGVQGPIDTANAAALGDVLGDIVCANASDFAKGVWALAAEQKVTKVLGGQKKLAPTVEKAEENFNASKEDASLTWAKVKDYVNKWYSYIPGSFEKTAIAHLEDYRTSVQGFPTLAFKQTKTGAKNGAEPEFIGRYNMLLDKGADEAYGFALSSKVLQKFVPGNPAVADVAECWEFENNSRGFCSFRDPWNRRELSFKAPEGAANEFTSAGAPVVADYFEYRYNPDSDFIDMFYAMKTSFENPTTVKKLQKQYGADVISDVASGQAKMLDLYKNWEKAVQWVWTTATDAVIDGQAVPELGSYQPIDVFEALFEADTYYIEDTQNVGEYVKATEYTAGVTYYVQGTEEVTTDDGATEQKTVYNGIRVTDNEELVYVPDKYYTKQNNNYVLAQDKYDASVAYYQLVEDTSQIDEMWKLPKPVTYGKTTYEYDTKEYRLAKFKNELTDHFNLEYLTTYFVITEVLECYDSRGKNAMFASWGPQKDGGDYIWYPIFYDLDTQLGINNTGIPSFQYNIDATEDGTFSTNDSVLWNNFYALFKNLIVDKYEQLTGIPSDNFGSLPRTAPFVNVDAVEGWYACDPKVTGSYSMKGLRPLLALNLDEQFKYISITNPKVGYPFQDGKTQQDSSDTYFYALQGSRSMSRRQFLTNRLNYIDSWLAVGNYKRGGANRIRSRISANNSAYTSDKWIEGTADNGDSGLIKNVPYFKEDGKTKTHLFDGEYWITMTPVRNMYVTVGTDAANFDPLKYSGTPVKFATSDLEIGVRGSGNYREQLYYIYGLDQMKSLGDLSRLYFQEFELSGKASKMTDLKLGYDGLDEEGNEYKNSGVNDWTIPAAAGSLSGGMPLLKEVNLSNVTFKNSNNTFDFSSCEKLKNFRNTGSNITQVTFADGVALDTLYLTDTTTTLKLVEARNLTNIITNYEHPVADQDGNLVAKPGLYIKGLTDGEKKTLITTFDIQGGNLGYDSYNLLKLYLDACKYTSAGTERKINVTNVQWSPYVKITDAEQPYDPNSSYFIDNGHFGLTEYTEAMYSIDSWHSYIKNGMMYEYDASLYQYDAENKPINITDIKVFQELVGNNKYFSTADTNNTIPNITGVVYIENDTELDEGAIQTDLATKFPGLTFFFAKVKKGFAARFVLVVDGAETLLGTDKISVSDFEKNKDVFFQNPITRSDDGETAFSCSRINSLRPTQDFLGWSTTKDRTGLVESYDTVFVSLGNQAVHTWDTLRLEEGTEDYTFYAVFEDHHWNISFYVVDNDGRNQLAHSYTIVHGKNLYDPNILLSRDESKLPDDKRYKFLGYTRKADGLNIAATETAAVVDLTNIKATGDYAFYALFFEESVFASVTNEDYFTFTPYGFEDVYDPKNTLARSDGYLITPKDGVHLSGKITLPTVHDGKPVIAVNNFGPGLVLNENNVSQPDVTHIYWYGTPHVLEIGQRAFAYCFNLKYFQIPESVRVIDDHAFFNCSSLKQFNLAEDAPQLTTIGRYAFTRGFDAERAILDDFRLPGSVRSLGGYCFGNVSFKVNNFIFGGPGDPCQLERIATDVAQIVSYGEGTEFSVQSYVVYTKTGSLEAPLDNIFNLSEGHFKCETGIVNTVQA